MASDKQGLEEVKAYLATLPVSLRARLVREIVAQGGNGKGDPVHAVVLDLVRATLRSEVEEPHRQGTPQRLFCEPLEPFLVDEEGLGKHKGFIRRAAIEPVWRWLSREAAIAASVERTIEAAGEALQDGDYEAAGAAMARLRAEAVPIIEAAVAESARDQRQQMNLSMRLEGKRNLEDLPDIAAVFRLEARLAKLAGKLPAEIDDLDAELTTTILRRLKDDEADLVYPLVLVYRRLATPAQIVRILTQYEGTDDGARLFRSRYAMVVDIMLAEMEFALERIAATIKRSTEFDALIASIRRFYGLANGMSVAIDVDGAPDWRKRLAAQRRRASEILSAEVETVPGAVRRVMRSRRGERRVPTPEEDVLEAEYATRLMMALRPYRGELAVNELLTNVTRQIEHYLEAVNDAILQELRDAPEDGRDHARRDLDIAVRINSIVFGESYAALLKRSGELAEPLPSPYDVAIEDDEPNVEIKQAPAA